MDPNSKVDKNGDVVARALADGGGGVLLHLESGAYHGVNQVGLIVWELIDGERTVAQLVDETRARVADPPPEIDRDVMGFLARAAELDLIVVVD